MIDQDGFEAAVELVKRCGGHSLEYGFLTDDVPVEEADWWATASFRGAKITVEHRCGPVEAVTALALRLFDGAVCRRCSKPVTLQDDMPGCRYRRVGPSWQPSCGQPIDHTTPRGAQSSATVDEFLRRVERTPRVGYTEPWSMDDLDPRDREFVERLAFAVHTALIQFNSLYFQTPDVVKVSHEIPSGEKVKTLYGIPVEFDPTMEPPAADGTVHIRLEIREPAFPSLPVKAVDDSFPAR